MEGTKLVLSIVLIVLGVYVNLGYEIHGTMVYSFQALIHLFVKLHC